MKFFQSKRRFLLAAAVVCVVVLLGAQVWRRWVKPWLFPPSPLVVAPEIALRGLSAKSLYYNGPARAWLERLRPELLRTEDKAFSQATQSPKLFRQLDRQLRFDTVLLLGDPSGWQRLIDHFLETEPARRDFHIVYLDHWAVVLRRDAAKPWQPGDIAAVREKVASARAEDRAAFAAKVAAKLLAVREIGPAREWAQAALDLDGDSPDALAAMAGYEISLGKWPEAAANAEKALALAPDFPAALAAQLVCQRATKHFADAFKTSERLNKLIPEGPVRLWQHAETAREAREYAAQVKALERLIALAREDERPTGTYEFYLGDAHVILATKDDRHAPRAVEHFKRALADPLLSKDHRKFAEERLATIRERTGLK